MIDPLRDLERLGSDALAPCAACRTPILTGLPVFYRVQVSQCGVDAAEVKRHVGLAMAMGGGTDGLVLADVLGPRVEPVVVLHKGPVLNICARCQNEPGLMFLADLALRGDAD